MPKRIRHWWGIDVNAWDAGLWTLVILGVATVIGVGMLTPLLPFVLGLTVPMVAAAVGAPLLLYGLVSWRLNQMDRVENPWSWSMWRAFRFGSAWMPVAWLAALVFLPWSWPLLLAATLAIPVGLWLAQAIVFQTVWNRIAIAEGSYSWMRRLALVLGAEPAYQYEVVDWKGEWDGEVRMYERVRAALDFTTMLVLFEMGAHLKYTDDMINFSDRNHRPDMVKAFLGIKAQEAGGLIMRHAIQCGVSDAVVRELLADTDTQPQSFDEWVWVFNASVLRGRNQALLATIWQRIDGHPDIQKRAGLRQSTLDKALRLGVEFCCTARKEADRNDRSSIEYLVVQGANPSACGENPKSTAFEKAFGHASLFQYFIGLGVLGQPGMRHALLSGAARRGDEERFLEYVDDWSQVTAGHVSDFEEQGKTSIRARWFTCRKVERAELARCARNALKRKDQANVEYYLDVNQVSPNTVVDDEGHTMLMYAVKHGYASNFIEAIMLYKPDVTMQNNKGETALHLAVQCLPDTDESALLVEAILQADPEVAEIKDRSRTFAQTYLHWTKPTIQKKFNDWLAARRKSQAPAANSGSVVKDSLFTEAGSADRATAVVAAADGP